MTSTTNFGLYQPIVNSSTDQDLWGGELNTDLSEIDGVLYTAMSFTATSASNTITVTAPTSGSTTTGSARLLYLCNATGGAFAANLPAAATATNMVVAFKKTDTSTNAVTITGHSSETIDGSNTFILNAQYQYVILVCDGTGWDIISTSPRFITGNFNYNVATPSGTQTITGLGFTPKQVSFVAIFASGGNASAISWGTDDGINPYLIANTISGSFLPTSSGSYSIGLVVSSGVSAFGAVSSFGLGQFTITWTQSGSPTGIGKIMYTAHG